MIYTDEPPGITAFRALAVAYALAIFHDELFHVVVTHRELVDAGTIHMSGDRPEFVPPLFSVPNF